MNTMTTELLDQSIQMLNNINLPIGLLESVGIPVYRAIGNLVTFRKMLLENNTPKEEPAGEPEVKLELAPEGEAPAAE